MFSVNNVALLLIALGFGFQRKHQLSDIFKCDAVFVYIIFLQAASNQRN